MIEVRTILTAQFINGEENMRANGTVRCTEGLKKEIKKENEILMKKTVMERKRHRTETF